mgnify:CR=1 FL=1
MTLYPNFYAYPGTAAWLAACDALDDADPAVLAARAAQRRRTATRLVTARWLLACADALARRTEGQP